MLRNVAGESSPVREKTAREKRLRPPGTSPERRARTWEIAAALALTAMLLGVSAVILYRLERQRRLDTALLQTFLEMASLRNEGLPLGAPLRRAERLVQDGATVRGTDSWGNTPLQWTVWAAEGAAKVDEAAALKLMHEILDHGANVDFASTRGSRALGLASLDEDPAAVAFLLQRGANPNLLSEGNTPLRLAGGQYAALQRHNKKQPNEMRRLRIEDYRLVIRLLRRAGARE